eukprot:scaffold34615_cov180-Amphora_coffeaeformis.AAC.16
MLHLSPGGLEVINLVLREASLPPCHVVGRHITNGERAASLLSCELFASPHRIPYTILNT